MGDLPVLVKPVISLGLHIEWVSEVRWTGGSNPESVSVLEGESVDQLLVLSLVVVLHDSEVSHSANAYCKQSSVKTT